VLGRRQGRTAREDVKRRDRYPCDGPGAAKRLVIRERVRQRRMHSCAREGHRLSPCEARDARPLFLRASTRPPFPSAIASRARQLIRSMRELGSVLARWADAKRPAAWRTAGRRTLCRASTGGIARGNGRNGSAQRHPSRVAHPAHGSIIDSGDWYQGWRGRLLQEEQNAAPGGPARDEPTPVSTWWLRLARAFARPADVQSGPDDLPLPVDGARLVAFCSSASEEPHATSLVAHARRPAWRPGRSAKTMPRQCQDNAKTMGVGFCADSASFCDGEYAATRLKRLGAPGLSTMLFGRTRLGGPAASGQ
jgi:hypothetical protein